MTRRRRRRMIAVKGAFPMDLETKFLAAFYAVLGTVTSAVLLVVLASSAELAALLVVVVAMFAMMGLLIVAVRGGGDAGDRA